MQDYDSIRALNWSTLKHMMTSALLYQWRLNHSEPPKEHFLVGAAIHCRVLEPEHFEERYALCEVTRNETHAKYKAWLEAHPGAVALNKREWNNVNRAADSVLNHRGAREMLAGCRHEEPLVWTDPTTGMRCKGRLDAISPTRFVDLKTAQHIDRRNFGRDMVKFGYIGQFAFYQVGAVETKKITGDEMPCTIAVEKTEPYDVAVYRIRRDDLEHGRSLCLSLMQQLEVCIASDIWPGQEPDIVDLELWWGRGIQPQPEAEF